MPNTLDALDYLGQAEKTAVPAVCAVYGDEAFLKRLVLDRLRERVLGAGDADWSLTRFDGDTAELRAVLDELATLNLFGAGRRLVLVEQADPFVSRYRSALEDYVGRAKPSGVLVLDLAQFPGNTRLAKAVAGSGLVVECRVPPEARLLKWLGAWAKSHHDLTLPSDAAEAMVEVIGPELGLLNQELAKLAAVVGPGGKASAELVDEYVAGWRTKTAWAMLDTALEGKAADALGQLDRLVVAGENPIGILGQIASTLRRFAAATRFIEQSEAEGRRTTLRAALERAEFKPFVIGRAEAQLRHLGRERAGQLYRWLLEADLAMKGSSSAPQRARVVLETLLARLAAPAAPRPVSAGVRR